MIKDALESGIKTKCQVNDYVELKMNLRHIQNLVDVAELNPSNWTTWYSKLSNKHCELIHVNNIKNPEYEPYWKNHNWFEALGIANRFYMSIEKLAKHIGEPLEDFDDYLEIAKTDPKMPLDVIEYYNVKHSTFIESINKIVTETNNKGKKTKFSLNLEW